MKSRRIKTRRPLQDVTNDKTNAMPRKKEILPRRTLRVSPEKSCSCCPLQKSPVKGQVTPVKHTTQKPPVTSKSTQKSPVKSKSTKKTTVKPLSIKKTPVKPVSVQESPVNSAIAQKTSMTVKLPVITQKGTVKVKMGQKLPVQSSITQQSPTSPASAQKLPVKSVIAHKSPVESESAHKSLTKSASTQKSRVKSATTPKSLLKSAIAEESPVKSANIQQSPITVKSSGITRKRTSVLKISEKSLRKSANTRRAAKFVITRKSPVKRFITQKSPPCESSLTVMEETTRNCIVLLTKRPDEKSPVKCATTQPHEPPSKITVISPRVSKRVASQKAISKIVKALHVSLTRDPELELRLSKIKPVDIYEFKVDSEEERVIKKNGKWTKVIDESGDENNSMKEVIQRLRKRELKKKTVKKKKEVVQNRVLSGINDKITQEIDRSLAKIRKRAKIVKKRVVLNNVAGSSKSGITGNEKDVKTTQKVGGIVKKRGQITQKDAKIISGKNERLNAECDNGMINKTGRTRNNANFDGILTERQMENKTTDKLELIDPLHSNINDKTTFDRILPERQTMHKTVNKLAVIDENWPLLTRTRNKANFDRILTEQQTVDKTVNKRDVIDENGSLRTSTRNFDRILSEEQIGGKTANKIDGIAENDSLRTRTCVTFDQIFTKQQIEHNKKDSLRMRTRKNTDFNQQREAKSSTKKADVSKMSLREKICENFMDDDDHFDDNYDDIDSPCVSVTEPPIRAEICDSFGIGYDDTSTHQTNMQNLSDDVMKNLNRLKSPKINVLSNVQIRKPTEIFNSTMNSILDVSNPWRLNVSNVRPPRRFAVKEKSFIPSYDQDVIINSTLVEKPSTTQKSTPVKNDKQTYQTTMLNFVSTSKEHRNEVVKVGGLFESPRKVLAEINFMQSTPYHPRRQILSPNFSVIDSGRKLQKSDPENIENVDPNDDTLFGFSCDDTENVDPNVLSSKNESIGRVLRKRSPKKDKVRAVLFNDVVEVQNIETQEVPSPPSDIDLLFKDVENDALKVKKSRRSYERPRTKRKRLPSHHSEEESEPEENEAPVHKKHQTKRSKKEEEEAEKLASQYNSMFEEIDKFDLCID